MTNLPGWSLMGTADLASTGIRSWPQPYLARSLGALADIFTVVIDTSVITGDVIKTLKGGLPSPLLLAMQTGLVRGFMAHHTWAEVPRVLAKRAPKEGVDPRAAETLWWGSYVRVIRFVPTSSLPPCDPVLAHALRERDMTDVPTLELASLIAPAVVLAADPDLKDIGLAYERWWEIPEAIRKMVVGQGNTDLAARAMFGVGYGMVVTVRGVARALQRPVVAITVASVVLLAVLSRPAWQPHVRRRIDQLRPPVRDALRDIGRSAVCMLEEYGAAWLIWSSAQRGESGRTLAHRVGRLLASAPQPMTRTELTRRLRKDVAKHGHRAVMSALYANLHGHQAFCEISPGRWQLGKQRANFGGLAPIRVQSAIAA